MSTLERQAHWQDVYQTKGERAVSWFQERPDISLDLIHATGVDASGSIIDIGGGTSRLVDALISEGFKAVAVLDLSGKRAGKIEGQTWSEEHASTMDRGRRHELAAVSDQLIAPRSYFQYRQISRSNKHVGES